MIDSIPYIKDWISQHPQGGNPNSILICGFGKSLNRIIGIRTLYKIYKKYEEKFFPKLLQSPNMLPEDKQKIRELLKKPWNPYIRRHSSLTEKSTILKEYTLRQFAGWSPGSNMHLKYLHYFGNESNDSILEAYGIISKDKHLSEALRPKQCPNCSEPNKPDSKFCSKCRMEFDVIAKPPKHIDTLCRDATPTAPGAVKAQICCNVVNGVIQMCNKCQYDANDNAIDSACINFYPERQMPGGNTTLPPPSLGTVLPSSGNNTGLMTNGQTGPPNHLGTVLSSGSNNNTSTLPTKTITKEHNTASPNVLSSTGNPTTNTGNPIRMMSSDNPPGCSEKIPIPPNCTLNPFPKSSATIAAGGRSLPGNIVNAAPSTANNSSVAAGVFGSLGNIKSVSPTDNNITVAGNNKNSSIARAAGVYSPTGGCSTGSRDKCIPCDPGIKSPYCIPSDEWPPSSTSLPLVGNIGIVTKVPPLIFKPTGNATNAGNNTSTPPALTITKEHNTSTPKVFSSAGNHTNTSNNRQTSGHHHHKGEQNIETSSTGNSQSSSSNNSGNTKSNPSSGGGSNGKSGSTNNNNNSNNKK